MVTRTNATDAGPSVDIVAALDEESSTDAIHLASELNAQLHAVVTSTWKSTGEVGGHVLGPVAGATVLLVARFRPQVQDRLIRSLLILRGLRLAGAARIILLAPLLPYARSDRAEHENQVAGSTLVQELLRFAGVDRMITFEQHTSDAVESGWLVSIDTSEILLSRLLERARAADDEVRVVLPDQGAADRYAGVLDSMGVRGFMIPKLRLSDSSVRLDFSAVTESPKSVIVLDDAVFTGGTHAAVASHLRSTGTTEVHLAVTHLAAGPSTLRSLASSGIAAVSHFSTCSDASGTFRGMVVEALHWRHDRSVMSHILEALN